MLSEIPQAERPVEDVQDGEPQPAAVAPFPSPGGLHRFTRVTAQKDLHAGAHSINKTIRYADLPHVTWE